MFLTFQFTYHQVIGSGGKSNSKTQGERGAPISSLLSPVVTKYLKEFHTEHHKCLQKFSDNPSSLYMSSNWMPHCILANRVSNQKLLEAFRYRMGNR